MQTHYFNKRKQIHQKHYKVIFTKFMDTFFLNTPLEPEEEKWVLDTTSLVV